MGKDGEAWRAAVHGVARVGHDQTTEQQPLHGCLARTPSLCLVKPFLSSIDMKRGSSSLIFISCS